MDCISIALQDLLDVCLPLTVNFGIMSNLQLLSLNDSKIFSINCFLGPCTASSRYNRDFYPIRRLPLK